MPIITKPATIDKNSPAEISLDKTALAAVASVVADDYFSDSDNWKEVFVYYKSSTGNQREILKFNAELASPTANFLVSDKALDIFEVQKIVIVDFDAGNITIPRSQLTVADFDVTLASQQPQSSPIVYDINTAGATLNASGGVSGGTYLDDYFVKSTVNSASGDFTYDFEIDWSSGSFFNVFVGVTQDGGLWYQGLTAIEGTTNGFYRVWQNGTPGSTSFALSLTSHTVRLSRIGSTMNIYIDDMVNPVHTFSVFTSLAIPTVRTKGLVACLSSSFIQVVANPVVVWDFASRPEYSLNAQSEIVSSLSVLSYDTSTILFSLSEYTIPANGLELKMVANNGWALEDAHFFGVCNPSQTVFNGFYYAANMGTPRLGINNILQTEYSYPSTAEVEFKIIIKTTQTEFYVNGVLQSTLAPVSNGSPSVKVATRFDNDINIKSSTIVEL